MRGRNSTLGGQIHPAAQPGKFHFPCQQRERGAPIRAFLDRGLCHGMVVGNVKPYGPAIGKEKFFFRGLIFPSHAPRAAKIDGSRLNLRLPGALAIPFQKHCAKGLRVAVVLLEKARNCFCGIWRVTRIRSRRGVRKARHEKNNRSCKAASRWAVVHYQSVTGSYPGGVFRRTCNDGLRGRLTNWEVGGNGRRIQIHANDAGLVRIKMLLT